MAHGRRVRLVVRRVEPWTVLKFSLLLFSTVYLVMLVAGLVLWAAATATGLRENVEKFIGELVASDDFRILGPTMLRASVVGGLILVVLGTAANVLFAVVYNLISDVVGGIMVVFEERPRSTRAEGSAQGVEPTGPLKPARAGRGSATGPGPDTAPVRGPRQAEPQRVTPMEVTGPAAGPAD